MKISKVLYILVLAVSFHLKAQLPLTNVNPLVIGEQIVFHSQVLNQDRTLNVYSPKSYQMDSTKVYPIIYLLDGSLDEDFIHISGLVQFGSFPWIGMLPESIVVGISNIDRKHDFTYPTTQKEDLEEFPTTGGSSAFIDCIEKEIQPLIELKYKCGGSRLIIGQSLGGLLVSEILLKKPTLFSHYMIISPSLWWDHGSLLNLPVPKEVEEKNIFIAVGQEGDEMILPAKQLNEKLRNSTNSPQLINFLFMPEYNHGNILHQAAYFGFQSFFQTNKP